MHGVSQILKLSSTKDVCFYCYFFSYFYIIIHINNVIKRVTNAPMNNATRGKYIRGARDAHYGILNQVFVIIWIIQNCHLHSRHFDRTKFYKCRACLVSAKIFYNAEKNGSQSAIDSLFNKFNKFTIYILRTHCIVC